MYLYLYMPECPVLYMYIPVMNVCNSADNIPYVCYLELIPFTDTLTFGPNLWVQPLWDFKNPLDFLYAMPGRWTKRQY